MKKIGYCICIFITSCNTNNTSKNELHKTDSIKKEATILLPTHTDDGSTYFAMQLVKNNKQEMVIESKRAFVMFGDQNFIIQLDSSVHMLVNGTALNMYINSKGKIPKRYQVVEMSGGKDSATMILSFKQDEKDITSFSPTNGFIEVTKIKNKKYSGNFEATRKDENGDNFILKGNFENVGMAE